MTALVLTAQPSTASVLLQITGAPAGPVIITRSDANGTGTVRLRTGQAPIAGALTVTDYEPAYTGPVSYDVVDSANATTTGSTTLDGLVTEPIISGVQLPQLSFRPPLITGYFSDRAASSTVHDIINRGDPVVVLGPKRTRRGTLEVFCRTFDEAHELDLVLAESKTLLLRQPDYPGMDMYFVPTSSRVEPLQKVAAGWRWQVTAPYVEVRNPTLPLLGAAGWTFDDLASSYATFAAVRASFTDFNDLLVGP